MIKTYTGLNFNSFNLKDVQSIVIYLYHSGTGCTLSGENSVLDFINQNPNKQIYVASLKRSIERYSTSNDILNSNVNLMYNISIESAYIKSLILSNTEVCNMENLFFENVDS